LSDAVFKACTLLNKGRIIIEVFSRDKLVPILEENSSFVCNCGNFRYYTSDDVDFLREIDFEAQKHICICSGIEAEPSEICKACHRGAWSFSICFENYLDTCCLTVWKNRYGADVLNILSLMA